MTHKDVDMQLNKSTSQTFIYFQFLVRISFSVSFLHLFIHLFISFVRKIPIPTNSIQPLSSNLLRSISWFHSSRLFLLPLPYSSFRFSSSFFFSFLHSYRLRIKHETIFVATSPPPQPPFSLASPCLLSPPISISPTLLSFRSPRFLFSFILSFIRRNVSPPHILHHTMSLPTFRYCSIFVSQHTTPGLDMPFLPNQALVLPQLHSCSSHFASFA